MVINNNDIKLSIKKNLPSHFYYKVKNLSLKKFLHLSILLFLIIPVNTYGLGFLYSANVLKKDNLQKNLKDNKTYNIADINWKLIDDNKINGTNKLIWEEISDSDYEIKIKTNKKTNNYNQSFSLNSLNRSIVFNQKDVGPDISWLIPPGFKWGKEHKFDSSVRGHSRRVNGEPFLGWNGGDSVGQFYFQPFHNKKYSFGINYGIRSVYTGKESGGKTEIGEGSSLGFRIDKQLSNSSGIAFGGEQILHFDGLTDTGRDFYLTASKGWWSEKNDGEFPLTTATFGFGTGKLAEGNIKGLCSDLFGGSGTEIRHQRKLCWAPIFSIARVYNPRLSTFFEYNSKWFLLGTSIAPFKEIPARGTFAIQISDHIDNYKIKNFNELKWVFRLSLGF